MARDLAVRLQNRIGSPMVITQGLDSDSFPTLQLTISGDSVWIRIRTDYMESEAEGKVDALGLGQRVYTPHVTELLQEAAATPPAAGTLNMRAQALAEVSKNGTQVLVMEGTGVQTAANYAAALALATTTVATIRSDDINPLTAQV
jgi:hypothetical protein